MVVSKQQVLSKGRWEDAEEVPRKRLGDPPIQGVSRGLRCGPPMMGVVRTVESEIIPRLLLARTSRLGAGSASAIEGAADVSVEVRSLADLLVNPDFGLACSYVESQRAMGKSVEALFLTLLAPTADWLGELWKADLCDMVDVTVGMGRLLQLVHELSGAFQNEVEHGENGPRVLLVPAPSEQHAFGVTLVAEFFRRAGWDVATGPAISSGELVSIVRREWFAMVGLSASCESHLDVLASTIRAVRRAARNRSIGIMVGGRLFVERPEMVALVGADATAGDAKQAPQQAEKLLSLLVRPG